MSEPENSNIEIRRIRRLLKQMYSLSEHSSLTGALSGGAVDAVEQYNNVLKRLEELDVVSLTLFKPLPEDASFDRLGVASKLLEGYLAEEVPPPSDQPRTGDSNNVFIGNIGNLDDLKDVGRIIRDNLPDFLKKRVDAETAAPVPPTPPSPPAPLQNTEDLVPMPDLAR